MSRMITREQLNELENCVDPLEFNELLKKYTGIFAIQYTAYSFYDKTGSYIGDSMETELEDLLDNAYIDVEVDPKQVTITAKCGEWIGTQYDGYADGFPVYDEYECSLCGAEYSNTHNFCPNCGAKMVGGNYDR